MKSLFASTVLATRTSASAISAAMRLAMIATLLVTGQPSAAAAPRPNIVVILVDDRGFSDIGVQQARSPVLPAQVPALPGRSSVSQTKEELASKHSNGS